MSKDEIAIVLCQKFSRHHMFQTSLEGFEVWLSAASGQPVSAGNTATYHWLWVSHVVRHFFGSPRAGSISTVPAPLKRTSRSNWWRVGEQLVAFQGMGRQRGAELGREGRIGSSSGWRWQQSPTIMRVPTLVKMFQFGG